MKSLSIIQATCLVAAMACLGTAYLLAGDWLIAPVFLAMVLFWIIMKKRSVFWSASSLLAIYVFLAAMGMASDLSALLMVAGCTAALASWDLAQFHHSLVGNPRLPAVLPLKKRHLQSLALMFGASVFLAFLSSSLSLRFPFGVIVCLVLLAIGGLTYGVRYMKASAGRGSFEPLQSPQVHIIEKQTPCRQPASPNPSSIGRHNKHSRP